MPNPWKKAKKLAGISRQIVSSLHSKAKRGGESSLVVQVGFPTSLADLVVKNHSRLRKPSRRKPPLENPSSGGGGAHHHQMNSMASLASEIILAVRSLEVDGGMDSPESRLPGDEISGEVVGTQKVEIFRAEAVAGSGEGGNSVHLQAVGKRRRGLSSASTIAKVAFFMVILAIGSKKLALGISVSAFVLLLLELMGKRLCMFFRPCPNAQRSLDAVVGGISDLLQPCERSGVVMESSDAHEFDSIGSEARWEAVESIGIEQKANQVMEVEKGQIGVVGSHGDRKMCDSSNRKSKKLFRRFLPKKYRNGRGSGKSGKEPHSDVSSSGASSGKLEEEKTAEEDEHEGEDILGFKTPAEILDAAVPDDASLVGEAHGVKAKGSLMHLAFFMIVLSGLVGGRIAALVLTVVWCLIVKFSGSLWRRWRIRHNGFIL